MRHLVKCGFGCGIHCVIYSRDCLGELELNSHRFQRPQCMCPTVIQHIRTCFFGIHRTMWIICAGQNLCGRGRIEWALRWAPRNWAVSTRTHNCCSGQPLPKRWSATPQLPKLSWSVSNVVWNILLSSVWRQPGLGKKKTCIWIRTTPNALQNTTLLDPRLTASVKFPNWKITAQGLSTGFRIDRPGRNLKIYLEQQNFVRRAVDDTQSGCCLYRFEDGWLRDHRWARCYEL